MLDVRCWALIAPSAGSILILTIWTLMVLGFLALAVGSHVAANIRVAQYLREESTAYYLARGGVEFAIAELLRNPSNFQGTVIGEVANVEDRFRDNSSLPGGMFSVWYTLDDSNTMAVVTNYGLLKESAKIDLDRADANDYARLQLALSAMGKSPTLTSAIFSNYPSQKTVAPEYLNRYGPYEAVAELLAVEGVDGALMEALEPMVTLREFQRHYRGDSETYERRDAYGAVAEGRVVAMGADGRPSVAAVRRIAFVYDQGTTNLLYWREH
jgi:type II secretory pathway component PulK